MGQATAATSADAQAQALASVSTDGLGGRALSPAVNAGGTTETITETTTRPLTGRDTDFAIFNYVGSNISKPVIGNLGRCDQPFTGCEGGLVYDNNTTLINVDLAYFQDLYVTTTTERLITSTGTVFLDIPLAGYGQGHAGAQAVAFDLGDLFLRRLMEPGPDAGRRVRVWRLVVGFG